jgi:hypothetical protein
VAGKISCHTRLQVFVVFSRDTQRTVNSIRHEESYSQGEHRLCQQVGVQQQQQPVVITTNFTYYSGNAITINDSIEQQRHQHQ